MYISRVKDVWWVSIVSSLAFVGLLVLLTAALVSAFRKLRARKH
jgi:hypothetical protein